MPVDLELTEDNETEWTGEGDLRTVDGDEQVRQSIYITVRENVNLRVPGLTSEIIEETRSDIERAVRRNEHTEEPITVDVGDINYETQTVTFDVSTNQTTTTIESEN